MFRKSYKVSLELEIKSITCPGVWLCLNGFVSLIVSTLDTEYETRKKQPYFPFVFHEVYYFTKNIEHIYGLTGLQRVLEKEKICFLLIQWSVDCECNEEGVILAKYVSPLSDLLYPSSMSTSRHTDLLMEPSSSFPGILAPKIEIITKIKISEELKSTPSRLINIQPHIRHLDYNFTDKFNRRSHTVCHTNNYHKQRCSYNYHSCKKKNLNKNICCEDECLSKNGSTVETDSADESLKDKVLKVHQLSSCGICTEYNKLFKSPSVNKKDRELTYEIPGRRMSDKFQEDITEKLHYTLKDIFSESKVRFDDALYTEDLKIPKACCKSATCISSNLLKKYDKLSAHCLCK